MIIAHTLTLIKLTPHSLAIALASIVFPVPGIPYNSTPFCSLIGAFLNISGYFNGHCRISTRALFTSASPPISDQTWPAPLYNCMPCKDIGVQFFRATDTFSSSITIGGLEAGFVPEKINTVTITAEHLFIFPKIKIVEHQVVNASVANNDMHNSGFSVCTLINP